MPNHLYNKELNIGSNPEDRPIPEDVIMQYEEGDNNPYRGIENHGVKHHSEWPMPPENEGEGVLEHTVELPPEPIPVRIVTSGGNEIRSWIVRRDFVSPSPQCSRILPKSTNRTKALIRNTGTATIYIAPEPLSNSQFGYPIPTGYEMPYNQEGEIWAITDDPAQQSVALLIEFSIKE